MEGKLELSDYIYIFNSWVLMKWKEAFILLSFFLKKYLFIWLCWHVDLHCSAWAPSLWRIGSIVAVWGLSCLVVCGILVTWPGIIPESPALQGRFLTPGPSGKSLYCFHVKQTHKHISASSYLKILKFNSLKAAVSSWNQQAFYHPCAMRSGFSRVFICVCFNLRGQSVQSPEGVPSKSFLG